MSVERYAVVQEDLRAKILDGTYPVGEPLPHTDRLKEMYGVSAATITKAMTTLKDEGLIWRVANRGMIVQPPPVPVHLSIATAPHYEHQRWAEACRRAGITGRIQEGPRTFTGTLDSLFAQALSIDEDEPVVMCPRTAVVNEQTAVFHDRAYYPISILGDAPPDTVTSEAVGVALSRINPNTSYADITINVRPARDRASRLLKISEGVPIYDITRTIYDEHGRPYELLRRVANPLWVRLSERRLAL